jgi:hypothetical protein
MCGGSGGILVGLIDQGGEMAFSGLRLIGPAIILAFLATGCSEEEDSYPYDGVWQLNLAYSLPGCGTGSATTAGSVAVSSGQFSYSGTVAFQSQSCGEGTGNRTVKGNINDSGVVSGSIEEDDLTFAGNCASKSACGATGSSNVDLQLTKS